ncbi:TPA: SGNH/GDSL hydrolase family protein [Streptococcus suis]|nr:SGNH/GDSL hydrolase family protein [Streptococcus suis]
MSGIDKHLEIIKNGVFGREVRQAIHDGIQQVYEDATMEHGNTDMEVAKARGEFDNLAQHLSNINANANTANKLAQSLDATKLDKKGIEQITYEMLTQDVKEKLTGGSVAVVGQNAVSTSNIVNGSVTDQKLDERMGFGVVLSGRLLIDATNSKVVMDAGTYYQVGKRKNAPTQKVECPYVKNNGMSQYIVYNDERNTLSVYTLSNITQITNRDTILAITYADTLIYPQFSRFIETKGLAIGERTHFINGSWGTLIQGKIVHNPTTNEFEISKERNDFIVAYKGTYYQVPEVQNIKINTGAGLTLYLNTSTRVIEMLPMLGIQSVDKTSIPNSANRIKIAEFYLGKLHHISHPENIYQVNASAEDVSSWQIEQLKIDLQTKRTVVVTLGDSTTDGYRTSSYSGNQLGSLTSKPNTWTEILNTIINNQKDYGFNHKFYNRGFSGKTIAWLKDNLDAVLAPITEKIDYAFITMGINDSVYDASQIQAFRDNHVNVINRLLTKGIKPILMSTQAEFENYNRFGSKINSIADNIKKDLAAELGIPFIDYNAGTRNILNNSEYSTKSLIPDMCHFGDLGHQKSAEFLAGQLIHQTMSIDKPTKLGYQNNKVVSDLNYSDHLTDDLKEIKWITRKDGFDLEGQLNASEAKTMFEVSVYIEQPMTVNYFGDNVTVTSNGQPLSNGTTLDIGFYRITVKNQPNMVAKFRGLKFLLKEYK